VAEQSIGRASSINRPNRLLRCAVAMVLVLLTAGLALILARIELENLAGTLSDLAQGIDAVLNVLILGAGGVYFLVTYEQRLRRQHILTAMHELRSLAHIIDMHQLTKDPERLSESWQNTPASPQQTLTRFQLGRYLDYCSEMLAVVSKLAAVYAQHVHDPEALRAVDVIENLTTGLSGKIWQKITILAVPATRTVRSEQTPHPV
jgi:hypothetical protein